MSIGARTKIGTVLMRRVFADEIIEKKLKPEAKKLPKGRDEIPAVLKL